MQWVHLALTQHDFVPWPPARSWQLSQNAQHGMLLGGGALSQQLLFGTATASAPRWPEFQLLLAYLRRKL